jgi:hypothetical protein
MLCAGLSDGLVDLISDPLVVWWLGFYMDVSGGSFEYVPAVCW